MIWNPRWPPPQVIVLTQGHMGKHRNIFFSEAIALIEPKVCIKLCDFYVDRNSKMTTTAGLSFYIHVGPIGSFYNQVNDTGSWEPLVCFLLSLGHLILTVVCTLHPTSVHFTFLPSLGVCRPLTFHILIFSLVKLLNQMNWNLVGSIYRRSSLKIEHLVLI